MYKCQNIFFEKRIEEWNDDYLKKMEKWTEDMEEELLKKKAENLKQGKFIKSFLRIFLILNK